jgi:hypothetical protein
VVTRPRADGRDGAGGLAGRRDRFHENVLLTFQK